MSESTALFTNDAVVLGILALVLGLVFHTERSAHPFWQRFYRYVPALLLCYFIPGLLNSAGIIDGESSRLYFVSSQYLLPASLVLLTMATDLPGIARLGPKAIVMFLTGTAGILIGGPVALIAVGSFHPELLADAGPASVWRGLGTIAGSWIGGGANQTAMAVMLEVDPGLFSQMVAVDVLVANAWMAVLLYLAARAPAIDARRGADTSAIEDLKGRLQAYRNAHARVLTLPELVFILALGFGASGLAHFAAGGIVPMLEASAFADVFARMSLTSRFFWVVVIATAIGIALSFTRFRRLEGAGATVIGSGLLYVLIASIGMRMDILAVFDRPALFLVGVIWIGVHAVLLLAVGRLIRAPLLYLAVGSQANVGGAASAPVVAAAFHPSLAPVGVLLAVLGYGIGTYGGWLCAQIMRIISGG
jgi:uncharacterized membrane protein